MRFDAGRICMRSWLSFLSVASPRSELPNGTIRLVYLGALILALSVLTLGIGLVHAAVVSMTKGDSQKMP